MSAPWITGIMLAALGIAGAALAVTLVNLRYYRDSRRGSKGRPSRQGSPDDKALVSVCVPARNEEACIERCVREILASDWPRLEVLVYDDQSTDETPAIIDALIVSDPRVRRVDTRPLPAGWVGKQWACHTMGEAARGEWLIFTDADVRFGPGCVRAAMCAASDLDAALVSSFPRQETGSLGERLIVPMIHFILFAYLPMWLMRRSLSPGASAGCGQFLCVRRDAYSAIGGHGAWKDSMHDGIRMPRALRRAGYRTDLFDATSHLSCRMYQGFAATWRGFAKNAYEGLGSPALLVFLTVTHLVGHVLPWVVMIGAVFEPGLRGWPLVLACAAVALALAQRAVLARVFDQRLVGVLLHPLAIVLMMLIQWHSFALSKIGRRSWRGREAPHSGASHALPLN